MSDQSPEEQQSEDAQIAFSAIYRYTLDSLFPPFMLETVLFGVISMIVFLSVYTLLRSGLRRNRNKIMKLGAIVFLYLAFIIHWALSINRIFDLFFGGAVGINFSDTFAAAPEALYPLLGPLTLETVLFGVFCTLISLSCFVLAEKGLRTRANQSMLGITLLMFAISSVHWLLQVALVPANFGLGALSGSSVIDPGVAPVAILTTNIILSDAIVLWRMCVLWRNHIGTWVLPGVLLSTTLALSAANIVREKQLLKSNAQFLQTDRAFFGQPAFSDTPEGTAALVFSLMSNITATSLIGYKAWYHRRNIHDHISVGSGTSIAEKIMSLLVESGSLYCIIWILYIISSKSTAFDTTRNFTTHETLFDPSTNTTTPFTSTNPEVTPGADWFNRLMAQLTGIYPTIIIVLVALEKTHCDRQFTYRDAAATPSNSFPLRNLESRISTQITVHPPERLKDSTFGDSTADFEDVESETQDVEMGVPPPTARNNYGPSHMYPHVMDIVPNRRVEE